MTKISRWVRPFSVSSWPAGTFIRKPLSLSLRTVSSLSVSSIDGQSSATCRSRLTRSQTAAESNLTGAESASSRRAQRPTSTGARLPGP